MPTGVLEKVVGLSLLFGASSVLATQAIVRWWLRSSRDAPCQCQAASRKNGKLVHEALSRSGIRPGDLLVLVDQLKETNEILLGCQRLEVNFLILHKTATLDAVWLQNQAATAKVFVYSQCSQNAERFKQFLEARAVARPNDACLQLSTDNGLLSSSGDTYQSWLHNHAGQTDSSNSSVKASRALTWSEEDRSVSSPEGEDAAPALVHSEEAPRVKRAERPTMLRAAAPPPPPPPEPAAEPPPEPAAESPGSAQHSPAPPPRAEKSSLGLMVHARAQGQGGVVVTRVLDGEWAKREGSIREGDALLSINGSFIKNPDHLADLLQRYDGATLIFTLHRPHAQRFKAPLLMEVVLSSDTCPGSSLPLFFTPEPIIEADGEESEYARLRFIL